MFAEKELDRLKVFQDLLPDVRRYFHQHLPKDWPELASVLNAVINKPLGPLSVLPLASCAAVGGNPRDAIPVAAAWEALSLSMRILDDLQDQDRPGLWTIVGVRRAFNFSAALFAYCNDLLAQSTFSAEKYQTLNRYFLRESLSLAHGQDMDLRNETRTLEDYWRMIEGKNARAFALACAAGALCGSEDLRLVEACRMYGHHLGIALQLFDDFEGIWASKDTGDLEQYKFTLPLIYGLNISHKYNNELKILTNNLAGNAGRIRAILDEIHARDFMIWTALKERDYAIAALAECPGQDGVTALNTYITVIFTQIEDLF